MPGEAEKRLRFEREAVPLMDQLYTTALYLTRDPTAAEDLTQETYLRAFRFWDRFTPGTNCKAWMMTILHNLFRNRYRDRQRESRTIEYDEELFDSAVARDDELQQNDPADEVMRELFDDEVEAALAALPADFREVVVLVDLQGLSYEEAAEAVGCPIGTIRSRLSRARRLLYRRLETYGRERGLVK